MNDKEWTNKVFFEGIVECYMLADLAKIEANFDSSKDCGNCNFPLALQIFSCMDFIGWLISNPENNPNATNENIMGFVSTLFGSISNNQIQEVVKFVKIFRNGLAHEYFAKAAGVSRKGKDLLSVDLDKEVLVLDADILLAEFRDAITRLRDKVENNPLLAKQIRERYKKMQNNNSLVTKGMITKSQDQSTTTKVVGLNTPVYVSNASIAPSVTLPPELDS